MTHEVMVTTVWSVHGTLLLGVVAAFYKYGDRSDTFSKSLQGADALLTKLRRRLSADLAEHLTPMVQTIQEKAVASPILGPHGETYSEKLPALAESEEFRESIQKFIEGDGEVIVDLRSAVLAKVTWCFWAQMLSWSLLITLIWLAAVVGIVLILEKVFEIRLPDALLRWSWVITAVGVIACLLPLPFQLRSHDKLCRLRMLHDSP